MLHFEAEELWLLLPGSRSVGYHRATGVQRRPQSHPAWQGEVTWQRATVKCPFIFIATEIRVGRYRLLVISRSNSFDVSRNRWASRTASER
jgi:hypothetical protein